MGFKTTSKHGFHITFSNGYTVSVQFGPHNYCSNQQQFVTLADDTNEGNTAEVAVWSESGPLIAHPDFDGDTVGGYYTPEDVLKLLNWAASRKPIKL